MGRKRDKKGRFVKGDSGGPGRPPKDRERRYLEIARTAVTFERWRKIVKAAADDALGGDAQARRFLADYLLGPPNKLRPRLDAADNPPAVVESASDVVAVLAAELVDVARFPNDPRRAAIVARLGDSLLRAIEISDMAEALTRIEVALRELE